MEARPNIRYGRSQIIRYSRDKHLGVPENTSEGIHAYINMSLAVS